MIGKMESAGQTTAKGIMSPLDINKFNEAKVIMRQDQLYPHELVDSFIATSGHH